MERAWATFAQRRLPGDETQPEPPSPQAALADQRLELQQLRSQRPVGEGQGAREERQTKEQKEVNV